MSEGKKDLAIEAARRIKEESYSIQSLIAIEAWREAIAQTIKYG